MGIDTQGSHGKLPTDNSLHRGAWQSRTLRLLPVPGVLLLVPTVNLSGRSIDRPIIVSAPAYPIATCIVAYWDAVLLRCRSAQRGVCPHTPRYATVLGHPDRIPFRLTVVSPCCITSLGVVCLLANRPDRATVGTLTLSALGLCKSPFHPFVVCQLSACTPGVNRLA